MIPSRCSFCKEQQERKSEFSTLHFGNILTAVCHTGVTTIEQGFPFLMAITVFSPSHLQHKETVSQDYDGLKSLQIC